VFRYDVKLDYKDLAATATIELKWKHLLDSSDAYVVIPSQRLANRSVLQAPVLFLNFLCLTLTLVL
jgi:hypothetical protein